MAYTFYLIMMLYAESIIWAVLVSIMIRPFQHSAFQRISTELDKGNKLMFSRQSWLLCALSSDRKQRLSEKWANCGFMAKILNALLGYFVLKKIETKFLIPVVVLGLLLFDLLCRFGVDCVLMIVNYAYDKEERNNTLFSSLSVFYILLCFTIVVFVYVGCFGIVAYEVSKYSSRAMAELGHYGDSVAMERIKAMIGPEKFKEELEDESLADLVFDFSDLECSNLIDYLESVPFLLKQASYLDDMLVDFNYSTGKIADFAY